jgi:hypothetical protein
LSQTSSSIYLRGIGAVYPVYYYVGKRYNEYILTSKKYFDIVKRINDLNSKMKIGIRYKDEKYQKSFLLMDPVGNLYTISKHKHIGLGNIFDDY